MIVENFHDGEVKRPEGLENPFPCQDGRGRNSIR